MNDRFQPRALARSSPAGRSASDAALPAGSRLGVFEVERVLARSAIGVVYLATDHVLGRQVAIEEYLPERLVRRNAQAQLVAADAWQEDVVARGLRAFVDETRQLAQCDHPALVRIQQLFEDHASAYRVMPVYEGQLLSELRRDMVGAPDESALRRLAEGLLGAIECIHRTGQVHGGVAPGNILLLTDDSPLLLAAGAAGHAIGSDLIDTLMATVEITTSGPGELQPAADEAGAPPVGPARDLYALAETLRYCITAEPVGLPGRLHQREPLLAVVAREFAQSERPQYSAAFVQALDAALSPDPQQRPATAQQFRLWLERSKAITTSPTGVRRPGERIEPSMAAPPAPLPAMPPAALKTAPLKPPVPQVPQAPAAPSTSTSTSTPTPTRLAATPPRPPMPPMSPTPAMPDPMTIGAAATRSAPMPLPTPLRRQSAAPRRRYYKALLVGGLGAVALGVLALSSGAWHGMPALALEAPAIERLAGSAPTPPNTEAAPAREAGPTRPAPELPSNPPEREPVDPTALLATEPPAAGPPVARPVTVPARAPAFPSVPRAACAGRTEFALYRCMQQQCKGPAWAAHPQCVKLRETDEVG